VSVATPLAFARNAVVVAIHLGTRAVAYEELGLFARSHLRTILTTVAAVLRTWLVRLE